MIKYLGVATTFALALRGAHAVQANSVPGQPACDGYDDFFDSKLQGYWNVDMGNGVMATGIINGNGATMPSPSGVISFCSIGSTTVTAGSLFQITGYALMYQGTTTCILAQVTPTGQTWYWNTQSPSTCPTTPQAGGSIAALPMVGPISSISGASSSPKPGTKGSSSDAASVSLTALAAAGMLAVAVRNAF